MLTDWLASKRRDPASGLRFTVCDVTELRPVDDEVVTWLAERLRAERFHPDLVKDMVSALGWENATKLISDGMPSVATVRKGVLGEVLGAECIEKFDGYVVPVRKLRSMLASGQSLPATDVLAFKLGANGKIAHACYIEAKLRTVCDLSAAVVAEQQLADDMKKRVPDILIFVANAMHQANEPLAKELSPYLYSRELGEEVEEFRLHLTWEHEEWSEEVLDRVTQADKCLEPLDICVLVVSGVNSLVERVYEAVGLGVDPSDD